MLVYGGAADHVDVRALRVQRLLHQDRQGVGVDLPVVAVAVRVLQHATSVILPPDTVSCTWTGPHRVFDRRPVTVRSRCRPGGRVRPAGSAARRAVAVVRPLVVVDALPPDVMTVCGVAVPGRTSRCGSRTAARRRTGCSGTRARCVSSGHHPKVSTWKCSAGDAGGLGRTPHALGPGLGPADVDVALGDVGHPVAQRGEVVGRTDAVAEPGVGGAPAAGQPEHLAGRARGRGRRARGANSGSAV